MSSVVHDKTSLLGLLNNKLMVLQTRNLRPRLFAMRSYFGRFSTKHTQTIYAGEMTSLPLSIRAIEDKEGTSIRQ